MSPRSVWFTADAGEEPTFSGEVTYTNLDQKFAGVVAVPAAATVAKPAAVYELKDQNTVSLLLRAQRNW